MARIPEIESAVYNNFKFNYGLMTRRVMLQFDASYSYTGTGITNVKWAEDDRTYSTYRNVGINRRLNFNIYVRWGMTKKTNVMLNASVSRNEYIVPNASLTRWGTTGHMTLDQRLPWNLDATFILQATLNGASNAYTWAVPSWNNFAYNIALSRSFLKENRLRVSFQFQRPFGPDHGWATSHTRSDSYYQTSRSYLVHGMNAMLSISYRFGSLQVQVKKAAKTISNDDGGRLSK